MEGTSLSKEAAYGDVFGGSPRSSAPFAARLDEYAETFGGLGSSDSIPFLDLPPAMDGLDDAPAGAWRCSGFDYSEVFRGSGFEEFEVSYKEMFAGSKIEEAGSRGLDEPTISQRALSEVSPEYMNEVHVACAEDNHFPSNSDLSDHDSKQSNLSYIRAGSGSTEGAISELQHVTNPLEFVSIFNTSAPLQTRRSDGPCSMVQDYGKLQSKFLPNSSSDGLKNSGNDIKADSKKSSSSCPESDNDHKKANLNHHSHSSSSNSVASEDASSSNVRLSNISLQTQPLRVPASAKLSPKIFSKKEQSMLRTFSNSKIELDGENSCLPNENPEEQLGLVVSKSNACHEVVKDSSFIDLKVEASSAAAAVKEAMELAQARLRSAKELMEKKRVNFHNRRKLGHHENEKEHK